MAQRSTDPSGSFRLFLPTLICLFLTCTGLHANPAPAADVIHLPLGMPRRPFGLRFSPEELARQPVWADKVDAILFSRTSEPVVRLAAQTLRDTLLAANLGSAFIVEAEPGLDRLPPALEGGNVIVLGRPEDLRLVADLVARESLIVADAALNGDGFVIRPVQSGGRLLLVTSCASRGVLYGAYEIEERTGSRGVPVIDQTFVPAVRHRSWSFYQFLAEPPEMIGRWRYNLSIHYFDRWPGLLEYPDYPQLGGGRNRAARLETQRAVHRQLADASKYGAVPALIFNPFTFTAGPSRYGAAR